MHRVLVTGSEGLAGRHLCKLLSARGCKVWGLSRRASGIDSIACKGDLRDPRFVRKVVRASRPDEVYHLAAVLLESKVQERPSEAFDINVGGTLVLLDELRALSRRPRILIAGSSAVYAPSSKPLSESSTLGPVSLYGTTKRAQEEASLWYARRHSLPLWVARTFNHVGPGQPEQFVCSGFAKQIALAEKSGRGGELATGDLRPTRDFLDTRDVVEAYTALLQADIPEPVVNICSGTGVTIRSVATDLASLARAPITIRQGVVQKRPHEILRHTGDGALLRKRLDWKPSLPWAKTLVDLLDYWRHSL